MFNPLNDPQAEQWLQRFQAERQVDQWFQCFNAPLKRLPAEERAALSLEVKQHLEALADAHEELGSSLAEAWSLALKQFGNPTKIGRKLCREWQQGKTGHQADTQAIWFATTLVSNQVSVLILYINLRSLWLSHRGIMPDAFPPLPPAVYLIFGLGGALLVGVAIGRSRPLQAIKAAFYASILSASWWGITVVVLGYAQSLMGLMGASERVHLLPLTPVWELGLCIITCGIAYLASVTKRGWYKPTLADFKLTLPTKWGRRLSSRC